MGQVQSSPGRGSARPSKTPCNSPSCVNTRGEAATLREVRGRDGCPATGIINCSRVPHCNCTWANRSHEPRALWHCAMCKKRLRIYTEITPIYLCSDCMCPVRGCCNVTTHEELARQLQYQLDADSQVSRSGPLQHTKPPSNAGLQPDVTDPEVCAGCNKPLHTLFLSLLGGDNVIRGLGRKWHKDCFRCSKCCEAIKEPVFAWKEDMPYHQACHRDMFHPRCDVCQEFISPKHDGQISYLTNDYWGNKFCTHHLHDDTPRCSACDRLQSVCGGDFVFLQDQRALCLSCLDSIICDSKDCQALYDDILSFYQSLGMPLPVRPPLLLVENSALNLAEEREGVNANSRLGPVYHTRGLCITEVHQHMQTVRKSTKGWFVTPQEIQIPQSEANVTGILVLYGMPCLLTGGVLAHELMHAWLKLSGNPCMMRLKPRVEEGLCQMMAQLWLAAQRPGMVAMQGQCSRELLPYFQHQIRTDPSPIYGEGFRDAWKAFTQYGLESLLSHIRLTGEFPL